MSLIHYYQKGAKTNYKPAPNRDKYELLEKTQFIGKQNLTEEELLQLKKTNEGSSSERFATALGLSTNNLINAFVTLDPSLLKANSGQDVTREIQKKNNESSIDTFKRTTLPGVTNLLGAELGGEVIGLVVKHGTPLIKKSAERAYNRLYFLAEESDHFINYFKQEPKQALEKGNLWLDSWLKHPETMLRIEKSAQPKTMSVRRGRYSSSNNTSPLFKSIEEQNHRVDFPSKRNTLLSFFKGEKSDLSGNYGISGNYLDPWVNGYKSRRQNLVRRNIDPEEIIRTTIHEGTHGFTNSNTNLPVSQTEMTSPFYNIDDIVNELTREGLSPLSKYETKEINYLTDPTEIYARLMEERFRAGLKPGELVTKEKMAEIIENGINGKEAFRSKWLSMVKDPEKLRSLFNTLPLLLPALAFIKKKSNE